MDSPGNSERRSARKSVRYERSVLALALLSGAPAVLTAVALLAFGDYAEHTRWTLGSILAACWLAFAFGTRARAVLHLRVLANLLSALRAGDYSLRARAAAGDAFGEAMDEANRISEMLREQRLSTLEATQLLRAVMQEIAAAVFAFDENECLRLVNRAGELLLDRKTKQIEGLSAARLGLEECLRGEAGTVERRFPGGAGRWRISRRKFRENGKPYSLLVISDLTRELREEELLAWQRLVRVLGHELNNTLTPIRSIADTLRVAAKREPRQPDFPRDLDDGLQLIASRAESLSRFTAAYARLAGLPAANPRPARVADLVEAARRMETRMAVAVEGGPQLLVEVDAPQIEQALINLVRNAVDAATETGGGVGIRWELHGGRAVVSVLDEGRGLANDANLFVPFYTTKSNGAGIGLVLSRRIAENHGGMLTLQNRRDRGGCEARLELPTATDPSRK